MRIPPYLECLILLVWLPLGLLWLIFWQRLYIHRKLFLEILVVCFVGALPIELLSAYSGIWTWPASCCTNVRLFRIPPEEYLFILFVPTQMATLALLAWELSRRKS